MKNYALIPELYFELFKEIFELQEIQFKLIKIFFLQAAKESKSQDPKRIKLAGKLEKYHQENREALRRDGLVVENLIKNNASTLMEMMNRKAGSEKIEQGATAIVTMLKKKIKDIRSLKEDLGEQLLKFQKMGPLN